MKEKEPSGELGIYLHIPFCVRKCLYCDFLSAPGSLQEMEHYVEALTREILEESVSYKSYTVKSVFLGGGTPSLLSGESVKRILQTVYDHYRMGADCEISMEVNPGTASPEKLDCWRKAGVNRLSIGLQSVWDEELKALGRIHTGEDFFRTYRHAIKSGFNNINIDLMFGIPGQTKESYAGTLKKVVSLEPPPTHISAYSLILEEGTPFYENRPILPDEETEREMNKITSEILSDQGYRQYEISNYARPGYACVHNQIYWTRGNYAGFGIGAASMVENVRFQNTSSLEAYLARYLKGEREKRVKGEGQILSRKEQMEEFMFLGLRMTKGVSTKEFQRLFDVSIEQMYPGVVEDFVRKGLLVRGTDPDTGEERIRLTAFGMDVSNMVMSEFIFL